MMHARAAVVRAVAFRGGRSFQATRCLAGGPTGKHIVIDELLPPVQDMPPEGGYPEITTTTQNKARGPPGWAIWAGSIALIAFGFKRVGDTNIERNANKREKRDARLAIVPYLQAEEDVRYQAYLDMRLEDEATVMKGVKGWVVGEPVYNTKTWVPPTPLLHPRLDCGAKVEIKD